MATWEQSSPPTRCFGTINVGEIDYKQRTSYASWKLNDETGTMIAAVSRPYFIKDGDLTSSAIIERALDDIATYRNRRRLVFSHVKVVQTPPEAGV
jgi:hypothetical protein